MVTRLKQWIAQTATQCNKKRIMSILGLILLSYLPLSYADTQTRVSAFEYDPASGLLVKEIIEPDDPAHCLVTAYTYDNYGNKVSATTRNCDGSAGSHPGQNTEAAAPAAGSVAVIETRTSTTTYDAQGRFPVSSTNALGHTETKTYNSDFGTVASLTGPNNLTTTWTYDSFGKVLTENRADGTSTTTAYTLCSSGCPTVGTAQAEYTVTVTQAGAPYTKTYHDMSGRTIQTETQDINGATLLSQVQFDNLGRSVATSQPFKSGSSPVWTLAEFDVLDRPTKITAPDGAIATTTYNGYTKITTNDKSQTKTEITNSQGKLVTVIDANNQSMTYLYDAYGNLTKTTDALSNETIVIYDKRGRKTAMDDPDQGIWRYEYDALGQLQKQTDAKGQIVTFAYDKLGRMLTRNEPDLISTWAYDICDINLNPGGKCVGKPIKETTDNGYERTYVYDAFGRATAELDNVDQGYGVAKTFDQYGRVEKLVYPGDTNLGINFTTYNVYSASGYLKEVREQGSNQLFWQADATDNAGRMNQFTYGNGTSNSMTYDPLTGRVIQIQSGSNNSISDQSFVYDSIGNMTQRYDAVTGLNEAFGYDSLNRLTSTSAQAGSGPLTQVTLTYNAIGNIMSKSDIGTYTYASYKLNGQIRPHAVSKIMMNDGVTEYASYQYDANGNMISGSGRTMTWNSWNMPTQIVGTGRNTPQGTTSSTFDFIYNASHERVVQTLPDGTTVYNVSPRVDTGIHVEKRVKTNGEISYNYSLYAGSYPFGVHIQSKATPSSAVQTKNIYYHKDHLGSIIAMTDDAGAVIERRSYDAWGKRRNLNGTAMDNAFFATEVRHGFTGHETLAEIGLVHMNGRLYDPAIGRFLSADPHIQLPGNMQSYNRYTYVNNNPLAATDPSGYFFKSIFKAVKSVFKSAAKVIKSVVKSIAKNKVLRLIGQVAAAYFGGPYGAAAYSAAVSYADTGSLTSALTSGAISLASSGAFELAGGIENTFGGIAAHAAIGCASSVAGGGKCGPGALSAGFTKSFAGTIDGIQDRLARTVAASVVGGTASVLGGGKFENGAVTGAFSRLFNDEMHKRNGITDGLGNSIGATDLYYRDGQLPLAYIGAPPPNLSFLLPDYYSFNYDVAFIAGNITYTYYGDWSFGFGTVKQFGNPLSKGVSLNAGWINTSHRRKLNQTEVRSFLKGGSASVTGYRYIGGGKVFTPSGSATELGIGFGVSFNPTEINN